MDNVSAESKAARLLLRKIAEGISGDDENSSEPEVRSHEGMVEALGGGRPEGENPDDAMPLAPATPKKPRACPPQVEGQGCS
jgi:hypothetical protein